MPNPKYARNSTYAERALKGIAGGIADAIPILGGERKRHRDINEAEHTRREGVELRGHALQNVNNTKSLLHALATRASVLEAAIEDLSEQGALDPESAKRAYNVVKTDYTNLKNLGEQLAGVMRDTYGHTLDKYKVKKAANDDSAYGMDKAAIFIFIGALGTIAFLAPSITGAAIGTARLSPTLILPFIFSLITLVGVLLYVRKSR